MPWKVLSGGIFNVKDGKSSYPTGKPKCLLPDYSKDQFDTENIRKSLKVWKKYFPSESLAGESWDRWLNTLDKLRSGDSKALAAYAKGKPQYNITLDMFKAYNKNHVPDTPKFLKECAELDAIAVEEASNPTVRHMSPFKYTDIQCQYSITGHIEVTVRVLLMLCMRIHHDE